MANRNLQWISVVTGAEPRELVPGEEAFLDETAEIEQRPAHDPRLTPRDELIFLLHTAAEVEHALMAQYLFASWSVPRDTEAHGRWRDDLMQIAQQEMGHLATVQNILRAIGGPINFEREDYPFKSNFYPFNFRLQALSVFSLAKYVIAEMPETASIEPEELEKIMERAKAGNDQTNLNRVGLLYKQILDILNTLDEGEFMAHSRPFQAPGADWRAEFDPSRPLNDQVIVAPVMTKAEAKDALCQIAVQGEGMTACSQATVANSHFERLLKIYRERDAEGTEADITPIAKNPNTIEVPTGDPTVDGGRITNPVARRWAQVFNTRYRMLLADLSHYFSLAGDAGSATGQQPRGFLRDQAFGEMFNLSSIAGVLTRMSQLDGANGNPPFAGPPFEMPYTLAVPDLEIDRWRLHRDLISSTGFIADKILADSGDVDRILAGLKGMDAEALVFINQQAGGSGPGVPVVPVLKEVRILPPIAIARFGSSPQPMENYSVQVDEANFTGFRKLVPAETFSIDNATGEISGAVTPASVEFRDGSGLIKPVAPFFEIWARFGDNDFLEPLTLDHLTAMGLATEAINWRVRVGNHKVSRRTGDQNDRVDVDSGPFSDHAAHILKGRAANFKAGKEIEYGAVRFIKPTTDFPELRLRFTPPEGKVFGQRAGDPNTSDDVYDSTAGRWDTHNEDQPLPPGTPETTIPQQIYAVSRPPGPSNNLGYVDDSCDGVIEFSVAVNGQTLAATARVTVGPPDFAPDSFHLRTVSDEVEQILLGLEVTETISFERATDLMRRALETMRLMNTDTWNRQYLQNNAFPAAMARYAPVRARHEEVLAALQGLKPGASDDERDNAIGALSIMRSLLRSYVQAAHFTNSESQLMPAMMRGSDGLRLAVNRRQLNILEKAVRDLSEPVPPDPGTPNTAEANMLRIIGDLDFHANRHTRFTMPDGTALSDLFDDPPKVLEYLKTSRVSGLSAGPFAGQPLIIPGNAGASAFIGLLERTGHPMRNAFQATDPATQKKRIDIVREWIDSLTA